MDKILISKLRVHCTIGVYDWEREQPQDILLSIVLFTNIKRAGKTDRVTDSIDYQVITNKILDYAEKSERYTMEAFTEDVARLCLDEAPIKKVLIRAEKNGYLCHADSVGIEIERLR